MPTPELVLHIGTEGGDAKLSRTLSDSGQWMFQLEGFSMDLDENDDECWKSWSSEVGASYQLAVDSIVPGNEWVLFYPIFVHPDYQAVTWRLAGQAASALPEHLSHIWTLHRRDVWRTVFLPPDGSPLDKPDSLDERGAPASCYALYLGMVGSGTSFTSRWMSESESRPSA